jgi:hypothetical protein
MRHGMILVCYLAMLVSCSTSYQTMNTSAPGANASGNLLRGPVGLVTASPNKAVASLSQPRFTTVEESIYRGLAWLDSVALNSTQVTGKYWVPPTAPGGTNGYWVPIKPHNWGVDTNLGVFSRVWSWDVPAYMFSEIPMDWNQGGVAGRMILASEAAAAFSTTPDFAGLAFPTVDNCIIPLNCSTGIKRNTRPFCDAELAALYQSYTNSGDIEYLEHAKNLALREIAQYNDGFSAYPSMYSFYVQARQDSRMGAIWDISQIITAMYQIGSASGGEDGEVLKDWASGMVNYLLSPQCRSDWDQDWPDYAWWEWNYCPHGIGSLMKTLSIIGGSSYSSELEYLRHYILSSPWMSGDGSYYSGTQQTAYMLIGLNAEDEPCTILARMRAEAFLRSADIQAADGSWGWGANWPDLPPITQVVGEVVEALATLQWVGPSDTRKVTGGGAIAGDEGEATFGFNVKKKSGALQGALTYTDEDWGRLEATQFTSLAVRDSENGAVATIKGLGSVNGNGVRFTITAIDKAEPGVGSDSFTILVINQADDLMVHGNGSVLAGGNIQIHKS